MVGEFAARGWTRFPFDPSLQAWARAVLPAARAALRDPALAHWHVCGGTWFVGVDALPNDVQGRVGDGPPLTGHAIDAATRLHGSLPPLHRAQLSAVFPGYPRPREGESPAAFRYRRDRDAAHVDGVRGHGPKKRRRVDEPHAFILGLPLTQADARAAPPVVWEGSHEVMRAAFTRAFEGQPPDSWAGIDVTEIYKAARREVFETCRRVELPARPGEATLLHRLALHGVAPWAEGAQAEVDGRLIAYFRPPMPGGIPAWLTAP